MGGNWSGMDSRVGDLAGQMEKLKVKVDEPAVSELVRFRRKLGNVAASHQHYQLRDCLHRSHTSPRHIYVDVRGDMLSALHVDTGEV